MGDRFVFIGYFTFSTLVCLFLCLFMCFLIRVSLVFMSASSVVSVCVYYYVYVYWGVPCFSLSQVLGLF